MVKPPKTMQPEAFGNLQKAGRASTKSFGKDSFHNYMARKIHMQREQFGVVVPPPPHPENDIDKQATIPRTPKSPPALKKHQKFSPNFSGPENQSKYSSSRRVSFAPESIEASTNSSKRKLYRKRRRSRGSAVHSILKKLKMRHGRRSSSSKSEMDENDDHDDDDDNNKLPASDSVSVAQHPEQHQQTNENIERQTNSPIHLVAKSADNPINERGGEVSKQNGPLPSPEPGRVSKKRPRDRPDLFFQGVVAMVNGYTTPDSDTIQRLLHRHGGDLEKYETVRITHIIAEHLSDAKAKMYKRQKHPRPVIHPTWILDSIKAQRQLPASQYIIKEMLPDDAKTQPSLASFFHKSNVADEKIPVGKKKVGPQQKDECPKRQLSTSPKDDHSAPTIVNDSMKQAMYSNQSPVVDKDHSTENGSNVLSGSKETDQASAKSRQEIADSSPTKQSPKHNVKYSPISPGRTDDKYIGGAIRTTGTDPHFLESFFSNSRLSYIGSFALRSHRPSSTSKRNARPTGPHRRFVFHIDMDCFFAAVVLRKFPQYRDRPVAISHFGKTHSNESYNSSHTFKGSTSECATCNYEARRFGIKKGMFLGRAKELCPDLVVLNYDFEGYKEVSKIVSEILNTFAEEFSGIVEEISCDESYAEFFIEGEGLEMQYEAARELAERIRIDIFARTDCTATVGVAENKFVAKLATDKVKPNGLFVASDAKELLRNLELREIHGIGYRLEKRLAECGFTRVQDVWDRGDAIDVLKELLGDQLGQKIWSFCQGEDDRPVEPAIRKTIGAECNYGVRFDGPYGPHYMIEGLVKEIEKRMELAGVRGSKITLKMKKRKPNAPEPPKFLGHGSCFTLSKSRDVPQNAHTRDSTVLKKIGVDLFEQLRVPKEDIRGMGIVVSNLIEDSASPVSDAGIKKFFKGNHSGATSRKAHAVDGLAAKTRSGVAEMQKRQSAALNPTTNEESPHRQDQDEDDSSSIEFLEPESLADSYDIDIPALSQLHMSQVDCLPSPMRKDIKRKVQIKESQMRLANVRQRKTESFKRSTSGYQPKMEDVLLLDAVRSGKRRIGEADGEHISLTQFEKLPFEAKVEVANGGQSRGRTRKSAKQLPQSSKNLPVVLDTEVAPMTEIKPHDADDNTFFLMNVLPLANFLDEHPPSEDSQAHVHAFFDELFDASMMYDMVILLRAIRNRSDSWSKEPYDSLLASVKSKFFSVTGGTILDV